ncbi:hypothetical protein AB0N14_38650 [Streptomyces sp. NPDC051104]|uniref:hypothetical protein n=1 Tax=Streptomyces sp. NPDC051104 TaxID=3155044 RepID=UPI00341D1587
MTDLATVGHDQAAIERLVTGHMRRFPWYADLVRRSGAASHALDSLPLLDQTVLEAHYYGAPALPDADTFLTSGTSGGFRKAIQYSASDDDAYVAQRRRLFADFLAPLRKGAVAVADLGTGHAAASARRVFLDLGLDARDIDFMSPLQEHVAKLNAWQPDVLFTMPMILDQILQAVPGLTARPRKVIVVGDLAPPAWREHVATRFGIGVEDVLDILGSIEIGAIAYLDTRSGRYVFHDHIIAEVMDPSPVDGEPARCRDHGDGVLVLTSLARDYFPAVRYVTGDLVSGLARTEVDGRVVTTCERLLGRVNGDVKHGERISSYDLGQAVARVFPGRPFEVSEDGGTLCVRIVSEGITDEQRQALIGAVRAAAPDVANMIDSGLVGAIAVVPISLQELRSGRGKRRFNLSEA